MLCRIASNGISIPTPDLTRPGRTDGSELVLPQNLNPLAAFCSAVDTNRVRSNEPGPLEIGVGEFHRETVKAIRAHDPDRTGRAAENGVATATEVILMHASFPDGDDAPPSATESFSFNGDLTDALIVGLNLGPPSISVRPSSTSSAPLHHGY